MICKSNTNDTINCAKCAVKKKTIFSLLSDDEISDISKYIEKKLTYRAGEYLINERDSSHYSLCINSGYLILGAHLENGSRQIFKIIFPGESVGFVNNSSDYSYFVQAVTDVDVCVINDMSVKKLLEHHHDVAIRLVEILNDNSNTYQQYLLGIGRKTAQEALAYLIMDLSTRLEKENSNHCTAKNELNFFPLNQEDMADVLGLTKVHVSRVISKLKKEKLIECGHKKLKVLNKEKLSEIGVYSSHI